MLQDRLTGKYFDYSFVDEGNQPLNVKKYGELPSGLSISNNILKGSIARAGTYTFALNFTKNNGTSFVKEYTLVIKLPEPKIVGQDGDFTALLTLAKEVQNFVEEQNIYITETRFTELLKAQVLAKLDTLEDNAKIYGLHLALGDGCGLFHSECLTLNLPTVTIGIIAIWRWERLIKKGVEWIKEAITKFANDPLMTTAQVLDYVQNITWNIAVTIVDEAKICFNKLTGGGISNGVQECFSSCGIAFEAVVPPYGTAVSGACDFVNGVIYLAKGKKFEAGASMLAIIPMAGTILKTSSKSVLHLTDEATLAVKKVKYLDDIDVITKGSRMIDVVYDVSKLQELAKIFYRFKTVDEVVEALRAIGIQESLLAKYSDEILKQNGNIGMIASKLDEAVRVSNGSKIIDIDDVANLPKLKAGITNLDELPAVYRGGMSMVPKEKEVVIDKITGKIKNGLSLNVNSTNTNIVKYGGPNRIQRIPDGLAIALKPGLHNDLGHFDIISTKKMSLDEYNSLTALMLTK